MKKNYNIYIDTCSDCVNGSCNFNCNKCKYKCALNITKIERKSVNGIIKNEKIKNKKVKMEIAK